MEILSRDTGTRFFLSQESTLSIQKHSSATATGEPFDGYTVIITKCSFSSTDPASARPFVLSSSGEVRRVTRFNGAPLSPEGTQSARTLLDRTIQQLRGAVRPVQTEGMRRAD